MALGFVDSQLYTITCTVRPFLGCYSYKIATWSHFGPKNGIFQHHKCSIFALLPLCELGITLGFVQSHLYTIVYNLWPFLGCYFYKIEICRHFRPEKGEFSTPQLLYISIITFKLERVPTRPNGERSRTLFIFNLNLKPVIVSWPLL